MALIFALVCTFADPQGDALARALQEQSCPRNDISNSLGFVDRGFGVQTCIRRYKV